MSNKAILDVEIDDSVFSEFKRKFDEYEAAIKSMPKHWQSAGSEISAQKTKFEKAAADLVKAGNSAGALAKAAGDTGKIADVTAATWAGMATSGKLFAGNIVHATQSLMHWTKLTAVFSGLLGAGGLFGINRMAASVAGQRTSAAGLGISYGEQASFLTNFGRLGNAEEILQGFSEAETGVSKKYALRQYLGHTESGDPAKDFAEGLGRFKEFVDKTPSELLGPMLQARGYDKLGLGTEQANIVRGMSREEVTQISRRYKGDLASRLGLGDADAKKWTEFSTQMERADREIQTEFAKGAINLTPGLTHLSDSFVKLIDHMLVDGGPIAGFIDRAGKGLDRFADSVDSGDFQRNVSNFVRDCGDAVKLVENFVSSSPGGVAALLGAGAAARYGGGAAVAAGTALARSGALGTLGTLGAGAAGTVLGPVGAFAVGGLAASSSSTNESMPERERQRRFNQGPYAIHHGQTEHRRIFGHPHGILKPGFAQTGAADPGTPWNREFQPHHGKRGVVSSHDFYNGLIARGATPAAAAALTGNAAYESGSGSWDKVVLDPATDAWHKNWGTGDAAVGAFQWEGARKRGVSPTVESETQHAINELKSGRQGVTLESLNRTRDPREAAAIVNRQYERPLHPNASMSARKDYAAKIFSFEKSRGKFGHSMGHHPATLGRAEKTLTVEDHTGGMVTVVPQ